MDLLDVNDTQARVYSKAKKSIEHYIIEAAEEGKDFIKVFNISDTKNYDEPVSVVYDSELFDWIKDGFIKVLISAGYGVFFHPEAADTYGDFEIRWDNDYRLGKWDGGFSNEE